VTIKFHISVETQGAVAVGSSAVLGSIIVYHLFLLLPVSSNYPIANKKKQTA
jgi:hypothetical protein